MRRRSCGRKAVEAEMGQRLAAGKSDNFPGMKDDADARYGPPNVGKDFWREETPWYGIGEDKEALFVFLVFRQRERERGMYSGIFERR